MRFLQDFLEFFAFLEILEFLVMTPSGYRYTMELMREIEGLTWASGSKVMRVTCYCPQEFHW
jgi:hypothetical protein